MDTLHRFFYVSHARVDACGDEPRRILEVARRRNADLGLTGLLLFSGDHFAQVLEGPMPGLRDVMDAIARDERHALCVAWAPAPVRDGRRFAGWSLAFVFDDRLGAAMARIAALPLPLPLPDMMATAEDLMSHLPDLRFPGYAED